MSFFATPYIITGSLSLYLSYKTYNAYYNQPFEYIEIEDNYSQDDDKINTDIKSDIKSDTNSDIVDNTKTNLNSSDTGRDKEISDKGHKENEDNEDSAKNKDVENRDVENKDEENKDDNKKGGKKRKRKLIMI